MNLEDITWTKSDKDNTVCFHLYVGPKKQSKQINITEKDSQIQRTSDCQM